MKNQTGVNVRPAMELAQVKASLLEAIDALINDTVLSREEIACDLLVLANKLSNLENEVHKRVMARDYRNLYNLAEKIELEREQKEKTSTVRV